MKFSILDIETTGLSQKTERIVELSVIKIDVHGQVLDVFHTLINPNRVIGATEIHGIRADMVTEAPKFADIALHLANLLDDSLVVAHNAAFDLGFLNAEMYRTLGTVPNIKGICTMNMSKHLLPDLPVCKLPVICEYFDIPLLEAHTAYYDCIATKELFLELLHIYDQKYGIDTFRNNIYQINHFEDLFARTGKPGNQRPELPRSEVPFRTKQAEDRLKEMMRRLPDRFPTNEVHVQEYVHLLDRVLSDRIVTKEESGQLLSVASDLGISRSQAEEIHQFYLAKLVRLYLLDRQLSPSETADLEKVASLLDLKHKLAWIIELERSILPPATESPVLTCTGKSICFTGDLRAILNGKQVTREVAHEIVLSKGMIVKNNVSSKLDFLVIADPYSQSTKARRARELNIPLLTEPSFWNLIGVKVD